MSGSRGEGEGEGEGDGESGGDASKSGWLGYILLVLSMMLSFGLLAGGLALQGFTMKPEGIILICFGIMVWILGICLFADCKQQRRRGLPPNGTQLSAEGSAEVLEERFTVPSYESVVGSGSFPAVVTLGGGNDTRISSDSQLPSYEDVLKMGPVSWVVVGGMEAASDLSQPQHSAAAVSLEASVAF